MSMSHTCRSLASTKAFPYFCSHSRRPSSIHTLTSPTPSLREMLLRNHSWNAAGLQGAEPPRQHGAADGRPTHRWLAARPRSLPALRLPAAFQPKSKPLQFQSYLGHWGSWTKSLKSANTKHLWDWLCTAQPCSRCQNTPIRGTPTPAWL